jgi:nucleotide-binding universal stress UspA family protein
METLPLRRVLFPTDFSACAERAFSHAAYLAATHDAELHVLHVVEGQQSDPLGRLDALRITPADIAENLHLPAPPAPERPADEPVATVEVERHGPRAADGILDYAREQDVDLIVMGTHGRGGANRLMAGSVAEAVVRHAPCPVFTVTATCDQAGPVGRVLAPVDLSEVSRDAARHARALADLYGARLDLLHVVDEALLRPVYAPLIGSFQQDREEVLAWAEAELARFAAGVGGEFTLHARVGRPALSILDFAKTGDVDLIVIGSHGRRGVGRALLGSVAETVIRMAPCPVFTTRTFAHAHPAPERAPGALEGALTD